MDAVSIFSKDFNDALSGFESGASANHDTLFMQIFDRVNRLVHPDTPVENVTLDFLPKIRGEEIKTNWYYTFKKQGVDSSLDFLINFQFNGRDELVSALLLPGSLYEKLFEIDFTDPDALANENLEIKQLQLSDAGATFKFITCGIDGYTIKKNI